MKIENFEYLTKKLEYRGWGHLTPQLEENMKAGNPEFTLHAEGGIDGKQMEFELKYRKHNEHDFYYFNRINATLAADGVVIAEASVRESWNLTPEEIYRIMNYGSKVAIYKENIKSDEGNRFNAYISVNEENPIAENGNLNLNTYHDNYYRKYPFDLDEALGKLPIPIRELVAENLEGIKDQLKAGIPVPVTMELAGKEVTGFLTINARIGRVDILDSNIEPIQLPKKQQEQNQEQVNEETSPGQSNRAVHEEKKKPWQNRQQTVNWNRKKSKGISM